MGFTPRLVIPEKGNKYYNTKSNGGYSNAIKGNPTQDGLDVLSNCVGYAHGRYHEICGDTTMHWLCPVNAERFIDYANKSLNVSNDPSLGAVIVWQKGATKSGSDGAGHVAIVEQINADGSILTSESGYGSRVPFYMNTRKRGNDNNWGQNSTYKFLGFIAQPGVTPSPSPSPEPGPSPEPTPTPAGTVKMEVGHNIYMNSGDALRHTNPRGFYQAGDYYVFTTANSCTNITKQQGHAGGWIADVDLYEKAPSVSTSTSASSSASSSTSSATSSTKVTELDYEKLEAGDKLTLSKDYSVYSTANNAYNDKFPRGTYKGGQEYYVFRKYKTCFLNITKNPKSPGGWIYVKK